jgi:hypothetical protein
MSGPVTFPKDHQPGMRVPKGGSSCSSCEYLGEDKKSCTNTHFIKWNGSGTLPAPPDEYCSDWYEPGSRAQARPRMAEAFKKKE